MRPPILGYLEYEARVKPEVKALVDRVHEMTDEEIDAAEVPLPWFRNALKLLKQIEREKNIDQQVLMNAEYGHRTEIVGHMAEYTGEEQFVPTVRGGKYLIELKPGMLVFFPDDGGVWIEDAFCKHFDDTLYRVTVIGKGTRTEYKERVKELLMKRHQ